MKRKRQDICDICHNPAALIEDTGMCGACCFGEASMLEPAFVHVNSYEGITLAQMDAVLKPDKGWVRYNNQGREYVYEFCVPNSNIRIKVMSGIDVKCGRMDVPGLDQIRMYAILYKPAAAGKSKAVYGLCRAMRIGTGKGWEERLKQMYVQVLQLAKKNEKRPRHKGVPSYIQGR